MLNRTNIVLIVLLVASVAASALIRVDLEQPNVEILPDMKYSPAWSAYSRNPNFADGPTMQPPVAGTIARGQLPLHYTASKEDAVRAGEELQNPFDLGLLQASSAAGAAAANQDAATADAASEPPAADDKVQKQSAEARRRVQQSLTRGSEVYRTFCISCHGATGAGDGPVAQRGFPPPPSLLIGKSREMKDGQLFHILTYGQGSMAPLAAQLPRARRWDVINHIRDMQSKAPPPPAEEPVE